MKTLYIIPFLLLGAIINAQEKKSTEIQDQEQVLKEAKDFENKMQKQTKTSSDKKDSQPSLASEQGLAVKAQNLKPTNQSNTQGKLIPATASFEEILSTIPNRKKANITAANTVKVQGIPNTSTLAEIKKTIPKN